MCRILNIIFTYTNGHTRLRLGLMAEMQVLLTFMFMLVC